MSRYSKFNSLNDYKNLSKMITNSSKDDLSNLLTPSDNNTNKDNVYIDYFQQTQFVGSNSEDNMYIHEFFSQNVVNFISNKCTQLLDGVDEKGREILVPDKRIFEVMNTVYSSYNYPMGFDATISKEKYIQNMIGDTIARIVYDVKNTLQYEQCTNKYTIWTSVYGDFNKEKLRQHAPIKILKNRPNSFQFNMKY
jgi:hypothetical protein